ncbi:MAG: hypothetical protein KGL90_06535 [Burkholderiales bacterium]|nr:hypothetical protein [Burkholderiales bacterium]
MPASDAVAASVGNAAQRWVPGHEQALKDWAHWCEGHPDSQCELGLSSRWLLSCVAPARSERWSAIALREHALQQWVRYFGVDPERVDEAWVLRWVDQPVASVVCAAPRDLIDGLQDIAREHGVQLRWVGPWWARGAQRWLASRAGLDGPHAVSVPEAGLTIHLVAQAQEGAAPRLSQLWTEVDDDVAQDQRPSGPDGAVVWPAPQFDGGDARVQARWGRRRASIGAWAEALDFVGPRLHTALWAWALLVGGLAAGVYVSDEAQLALNARNDGQLALHRLQRAQHQLAVAKTAPRAASVAASGASAAKANVAPVLSTAAVRQAARVAQLLAYPWPTVIERIEQSAASEQAVLTSLSLDLATLGSRPDARPEVRLLAAVRDDASALRWAQAHGEGAQLLARTPLSNSFDTSQGRYAWQAEASWSGGQP